MSMREIIWVVVNTNSAKEAGKIGRACLKARLCACFSLLPRISSTYYWPPRSNRLEQTKGPILTLETLPRYYNRIIKLVKKLHSDKVPFIGQWEMEEVEPDYYKWLKGELAKK